jgi:very-short-patch-repair endonuclease
MTDAEQKLWWHLRRLRVGTSHFRRQATIGPYFADFACHEKRLIVEVDGSGHIEHMQMIADAARTESLISRGYRVLRFWNNDVLKETDAVMTVIFEALTDASTSPPTPDPSPPLATARGGRGIVKSSIEFGKAGESR